MSTSADAKAFNWILSPFSRVLSYATDEYQMAGLIHRGLVVLEGHQTYLQLARDRFVEKNDENGIEKVDQLAKQSADFSSKAASYRKDGFNRVNQHALAGMWSGLEAYVEETVILILSNHPEALRKAEKYGIKLGPKDISKLRAGEGMTVYRKFHSKALNNSEFESGPAFASLLRAFAINLSVSEGVLKELTNLAALRDCIMHNNAIFDQRAARKSSLQIEIGSPIVVDWNSVERYFNAITVFLHACIKAVVESEYVRAKQ